VLSVLESVIGGIPEGAGPLRVIRPSAVSPVKIKEGLIINGDVRTGCAIVSVVETELGGDALIAAVIVALTTLFGPTFAA
jgi:hypothetical protein